jgi:SpoVK/Ycf46/Vps4 family AAA+-type ATPase
MAERQEMVYMFCTANNLGAIPPEFVRSGRFDTVRWFDLPTFKDCEEILRIHCKANGYEKVDIPRLAQLSVERSLTGAEIEHAIIESNYARAFDKDKTPSDFLYQSLQKVKSYAALHKNELAKARKLALDNYEFTSEAVRADVEKLVNERKLDERAIETEFKL